MSIGETAIDHLQSRLEARDAFCQALIDAPRVKLRIDTGVGLYTTFYFFMTPGYPIAVGTGNQAADPTTVHPMYYSTDWSWIPTVAIPYLTSLEVTVDGYLISEYSQSGGRLPKFYKGTSGAFLSFLAAYELTTMSASELFKHYGSFFALEIKKNARWKGSAIADKNAWSESAWPEMEGLATRYIDNVGVFTPDWTVIDFNLSHSLGYNLLGLEVIRAPDSALEAIGIQQAEFRAFLGFLTGGAGNVGSTPQSYSPATGGYDLNTGGYTPITGGGASGGANAGGLAQGIINTGSYIAGIFTRQRRLGRLIYPRIRAFGRQVTPPINYQEYRAAFIGTLGEPKNSIQVGARSWNYVTWNWKNCCILPEEMFNAFVDPLSAYVMAGINNELEEGQ